MRTVPEWIGKTDDTAVPPRIKLRVWDRCEGRCHMCERKIPVGDAWIIEHRIAIINSGLNAESNLCLTCSWCKPIKDAVDVAIKAKRAKVRARHLGIRPPSRLRSAGFPTRPKQHSATRPVSKREKDTT